MSTCSLMTRDSIPRNPFLNQGRVVSVPTEKRVASWLSNWRVATGCSWTVDHWGWYHSSCMSLRPPAPSPGACLYQLPAFGERAALSRSENSLKLAAEDVGRFGKLVILPIPAGFFEKLWSHPQMQSPQMNGGKARHISGMGDLALSMSHCQGASVSERCDLRTPLICKGSRRCGREQAELGTLKNQ